MTQEEILNCFQIEGPVLSLLPFGGGHINDTFHAQCKGDDSREYLLQKVNSYVFRDIVGLMNNIELITSHIRNKQRDRNISDLERKSLEVIKTNEGNLYMEDHNGHFWRVFNFIKDHKVYDNAPNTDIAFEGARMFGQFLCDLSDLQPDKVVDTIPKFHNIEFRLDNLGKAIKEDPKGRLNLVKDEVKYVQSSFEIMNIIHNLGERGIIPKRIVHNDTKINNVLFDYQDNGLCVIDLDTNMSGYAHYDFGDGIRTCANTGDEDDEDLKNVSYDLDMYEAFSAGYIESTYDILNDKEFESLPYAALLFPFIMGVRFLTDYIAGDVYYKTKYPEHNIVRARSQLKLAQDGEAKLEEMKRIIKSLNGTKK